MQDHVWAISSYLILFECQTLWHLLVNCTHANSFWNGFQEWYIISSNSKLLLTELEVMFGIFRCHTYCLALNHLIILGKYFLYVNALNTIKYKFDDFVSLVREKINIEKYIAVTSNQEKEFRNKWKFFSVFIKLHCVLLLLSFCILICFSSLHIYLIIY